MTLGIWKVFWRNAAVFLLIALTVFPANHSIIHAAGTYARISVNTGGEGANAMSYRGEVSANGRFAAFDSEATNLVAGDLNGFGDVFLRDLQLGTTVLVSTTVSGGQGNGGSGSPVISADGRYVAFESGATNLTPSPDTNGFTDIYVKDTQAGTVTRASLSTTGIEPNNESEVLSISGDGRYVVFDSNADNLVPNDTNGYGDIFVRDMQTNTTIGVSVGGNSGGFDASISLDGNYVVFNSGSTNFIPDDTNGRTDVFVYTMQTGQIVRASVSSSGVQGNWNSSEPSISGDGRYVTFSTSSEFATVDTYGYIQLYVRDMQAGTTTLATYRDGYAMVGESDASEISADGRSIVYSFDDKGDSRPTRWLYLHDRAAATNTLVVSAGSVDSEWNPVLPSISGDGRFIVFSSSSPNFVPGDTNNTRDVFVKDLNPPDLPPTVVSVFHGCPNGCNGPGDQFADFIVTFSEPVTGVDVSDFGLTLSGGVAGAVVTTVSGAGSEYIIRVDTGAGDGTLRLDVLDDDSIKDSALNPLGGAGAGNGNFYPPDVYLVDKNIVAVAGIQRLDLDPTSSASLRYLVNFSEPVSGVDASDFAFTTTGSIAGASVTDVSGSGTSHTVTVNTGIGDGTLRLDLIDNDSIIDLYSTPLGGYDANNGDFFSGDLYTLDRTPPLALAILALDPNPTAAEVVHYSLTFSEPVSGVDLGDFALVSNGVTGATITELFVNANTYMLTVNTGIGSGTIRLDLVDNDSIVDAVGNPLGGFDAGNGNVSGPVYTINKVVIVTKTERFRSNGRNDGWILESREDSGVGGTKNSTSTIIRLGDDKQDRQYRSILHFATQYLPDDAVITQAILMLKVQGVVGADPFTTHGSILVDIRGSFGSFGPFNIKALQVSDFQAPANLTAIAAVQNNPVGGWYWAALDPSAFAYISRTGVTQLRLAFQLDDNDDLDPDYLTFFSGDSEDQAIRPHLLIDYYLP
jgi:hypothetical protein